VLHSSLTRFDKTRLIITMGKVSIAGLPDGIKGTLSRLSTFIFPYTFCGRDLQNFLAVGHLSCVDLNPNTGYNETFLIAVCTDL
jgi:hypothetical protein